MSDEPKREKAGGEKSRQLAALPYLQLFGAPVEPAPAKPKPEALAALRETVVAIEKAPPKKPKKPAAKPVKPKPKPAKKAPQKKGPK
jgi:hypothetical protein